MSKWTLGKWFFDYSAKPKIKQSGTALHIATVLAKDDFKTAALIAAAPEMAELLARLADDLEDGHWSETKAEIRALLERINK